MVTVLAIFALVIGAVVVLFQVWDELTRRRRLREEKSQVGELYDWVVEVDKATSLTLDEIRTIRAQLNNVSLATCAQDPDMKKKVEYILEWITLRSTPPSPEKARAEAWQSIAQTHARKDITSRVIQGIKSSDMEVAQGSEWLSRLKKGVDALVRKLWNKPAQGTDIRDALQQAIPSSLHPEHWLPQTPLNWLNLLLVEPQVVSERGERR